MEVKPTTPAIPTPRVMDAPTKSTTTDRSAAAGAVQSARSGSAKAVLGAGSAVQSESLAAMLPIQILKSAALTRTEWAWRRLLGQIADMLSGAGEQGWAEAAVLEAALSNGGADGSDASAAQGLTRGAMGGTDPVVSGQAAAGQAAAGQTAAGQAAAGQAAAGQAAAGQAAAGQTAAGQAAAGQAVAGQAAAGQTAAGQAAAGQAAAGQAAVGQAAAGQAAAGQAAAGQAAAGQAVAGQAAAGQAAAGQAAAGQAAAGQAVAGQAAAGQAAAGQAAAGQAAAGQAAAGQAAAHVPNALVMLWESLAAVGRHTSADALQMNFGASEAMPPLLSFSDMNAAQVENSNRPDKVRDWVLGDRLLTSVRSSSAPQVGGGLFFPAAVTPPPYQNATSPAIKWQAERRTRVTSQGRLVHYLKISMPLTDQQSVEMEFISSRPTLSVHVATNVAPLRERLTSRAEDVRGRLESLGWTIDRLTVGDLRTPAEGEESEF